MYKHVRKINTLIKGYKMKIIKNTKDTPNKSNKKYKKIKGNKIQCLILSMMLSR